MKTTKKNTKRVAIVGATVTALMGGGIAYAYWTTSGTGTGSAGTGTTQAVTVSQVGTTTGLVPGGAAQAVDFKINNPATTSQYISTVTVSIHDVSAPNATATNPCSTADFSLVQPSRIDSDLSNGDHTYQPSGASISMLDSTSNQDGCKGATVNLAFSAQ